MPTAIIKGKAIIETIKLPAAAAGGGGVPTLAGGTTVSASFWGYISPQDDTLEQNWNEEVIQHGGYDASWIIRNENNVRSLTIKPTANTIANAKAATVFLAPRSRFTWSGSDSSEFDGDWTLLSGATISLKQGESATYTLKVIKYGDATQNAASYTTAS